MADDTLYGDDFRPGMEFGFGSLTLTEDDIVEFGRRWDPQLMHIDPATAVDGPWGGLIASGVQTVAVYQRLIVDAMWSRTAAKAGRSLEAKLRRPVRPGVTLTGKAVIRDVTRRPDRGDAVVVVDSQLFDDSGDVVLDMTLYGVIFLRT
jgi:acyl dehydratase